MTANECFNNLENLHLADVNNGCSNGLDILKSVDTKIKCSHGSNDVFASNGKMQCNGGLDTLSESAPTKCCNGSDIKMSTDVEKRDHNGFESLSTEENGYHDSSDKTLSGADEVKSSKDADRQRSKDADRQVNGTDESLDEKYESCDGSDSLLSEEEEKAIKESWALLWKDKKVNGISLFIKLFTAYPEAQEKFRDFRGLTIEEVKVHKKLRAHALSVVYALKSFIDNLDDVETLTELVRKTAHNHIERTVTAQQIAWVTPPLMEVFKDVMGDGMTKLHENAWNKLFGVVVSLWKAEQDENGTEL